MKISLIVAVSENGVIGRAGDIPWTVPADMRHFKEKTLGKPVIMGRKTWDSLGRPLPKRTNIVITRNEAFDVEGVLRANRFEDAISLAKSLSPTPDEIMIIGGAGIYKRALPIADCVYWTRIHGDIEGDTFFPDLSPEEWQQMSAEYVEKSGNASHACTVMVYHRKHAS